MHFIRRMSHGKLRENPLFMRPLPSTLGLRPFPMLLAFSSVSQADDCYPIPDGPIGHNFRAKFAHFQLKCANRVNPLNAIVNMFEPIPWQLQLGQGNKFGLKNGGENVSENIDWTNNFLMAFCIALLECAKCVQFSFISVHFIFPKNFAQFGPSMPTTRVATLIASKEADWLTFLQTCPCPEEMLTFESAQKIGWREDTIRTLQYIRDCIIRYFILAHYSIRNFLSY